jgi:YVTN family beta-propeller protein
MLDPRKIGLAAAVGLLAFVLIALGAQLNAAEPSGRSANFSATPAPKFRSAAPPPVPSPAPTNVPRKRTKNVYAHIKAGHVRPSVAGDPELVYVPNPRAGTLEVINPKTFKVIRKISVGDTPQHVTPSWNMRWLYVDVSHSNALAVIDPHSGKLVRTIHNIEYPYNLYFTPSGSKAIVVTEAHDRLDFHNPKTWKLIKSLPLPCNGPDHLDFSADGKFGLISCEFDGRVVRFDPVQMKVKGVVHVGGLPVDVKLSPDGSVFYVGNQGLGGVSVIDSRRMKVVKFLKTGQGAHGMVVSRSTRYLYVSNRLAGTISVISFARRRVVDTWKVGGSPDMLQVSPDGSRLWYSNRFGTTVSVVDTSSGRVLKRIEVGIDPHGLTYFPQPGRICLGHNGVYR